MKTPEEMAEEYADSGIYRLKRYVDGRTKPIQGQHGLQHLACRNGFLAGYQAATDWISVKDRLPEENEQVLVFGHIRNAPQLLGVRYRVLDDQDWKYSWQGDGYIFKQDYVTHWLPLPEAPKEEV